MFKLTNSLKQAITNIDIEESVGSVGKGMALSVIKSSEFIREVLEIA